MSSNARSKIEADIAKIDSERSMRSAFSDFVQFGQERRDTARVQSIVAPNGFAFAVQHYKGGEPFDLISLSQFFVLSSCFNALRFAAGEIDLHQNEILAGVVLELRLGKNGFVELKTKTAPVGPREIEQQKLMVRFRFLLGHFIIGRPRLIDSRAGTGQGQCDRNRYN